MSNILPINGRVAIIDDNINQALPIINELSKHRIPATYYSGQFDSLPKENDNDVRLIFLDINLIDNSEHDNKTLKSALIPILNKIVPNKGYPYVIVYWSRHEDHKNLVETDIFKEELFKNREPISFLSATKSDYFCLDGTNSEDYSEKITSLFDQINNSINKALPYGYITIWENILHQSTNMVLADILKSNGDISQWSERTSQILGNLCNAYLEQNHIEYSDIEQVKSSLIVLNQIYIDTIESNINNLLIDNVEKLNKDNLEDTIKSDLNTRLSIAAPSKFITEPGTIFAFAASNDDNFDSLYNIIYSNNRVKGDDDEKNISFKNDIKIHSEEVCLVVTAQCDYAQKKTYGYNRYIRGLIVDISKKNRGSVNKSEAVWKSSDFLIDDNKAILVFPLNTLSSFDEKKEFIDATIKFRFRSTILSNIQSRLSSHIGRQGIISL